MTHEVLARFRSRLLAERAALLARWRQARSDENELVEASGLDWQSADVVATRAVLAGIDARGRCELARIQSSLARIEHDGYDERAAAIPRVAVLVN